MISVRVLASMVMLMGLQALGPSVVAAPAVSRPHAPTASSKVSEAARHFRRGVELYDDGDLAAAFVEFSRANDILPSFKVFYNLGQISFQTQDYVAALDDFRRYLRDGGEEVSPERRRDVERDIRRLEERVGRIAIDHAPEGAEILVVGAAIGTAPLVEPMLVNPGPRDVAAVSKDGARETRKVDVIGGDTTHVRFKGRLGPEDLGLGTRSPAPDPEADAVLEPTLTLDTESDDESDEQATGGLRQHKWIFWSAAGLLGAGAAATGAFGLMASRDLEQSRQGYPLPAGSLDSDGHRVHVLGLATDGLLLGTAVATAVASYLTFTGPSRDDIPNQALQKVRRFAFHRPPRSTHP
jgi:hypothetical protein